MLISFNVHTRTHAYTHTEYEKKKSKTEVIIVQLKFENFGEKRAGEKMALRIYRNRFEKN